MEGNNDIEAFKERSARNAGLGESNDYEAKMLEAFVGKPEDPEKGFWYANAFSKYNVNGVDSMKWNWSWWAFFGGVLFLLYRKAYAAAGGLFLMGIASSLVPGAGLIINILAGGFSTYFVYKTYQSKKLAIEAAHQSESKRIEMMRAVGGYNTWAAWILPIIVVLGILAAVAIPKLANTTSAAKATMEVSNLSTCLSESNAPGFNNGRANLNIQSCQNLVCFNVSDDGYGNVVANDSGSYEPYCGESVEIAKNVGLLLP